ncbi:Y+L amino acid transporter [Aspergillus alliaceus]|uniref:Y+L amino acid transporter n=1 Tax=Petromyces alliaceus TaxID=209559 RepID=A0A8H6E7R6_PETAA|nr:Y+L amino acid transporter [Aspergillus burnettii]
MSPNPESHDGAERPLLTDESEIGYGSAARSPADRAQRAMFTRNLGAFEAFGIVISIVIGSGVFTSPGSIDTNVPSPGVALIVWLVGGMLAWTGATTMAELGTAIPGEGGVQPYLQYIFGDVFGFLAAWTWIIAVMPATLAILSIVFIESIYSAIGVVNEAGTIKHKLLSIIVLVTISVANSISTKVSTRLGSFFVTTKFVTIAGVVIAGLLVVIVHLASKEWEAPATDWYTKSWFGFRDTIAPDGTEIHWSDLAGWTMLGHYSAALYGALWAYSGWDKAIYVTAELSAPARQLPLAINTAIPIVILCFFAANTTYYILLPWSVVSTTDSVAVTAITHLLGPAAGIIAAILICLVVAGSLLGNSFVAGRMVVAASNLNWLPRFLGLLGQLGIPSDENRPTESLADSRTPTPKSDAPINAIALSTILPILYILFGDFRALLTLNGLGEYSFFFLTVLGAIILRFREPDLRRPYKPFVLIPIIFALVSGFIVVRGAVFAPVQAVILISLWVIGVGYFQVRKRWAGEAVREA